MSPSQTVPDDNQQWDLDSLCAQAGAILRGTDNQSDGRVRALPDARTVRYYTTIGLVDRPTLQGRTGLYGTRHLLQVVATKRLQADGASLAEVQSRLMGLDDDELRAIAELPTTLPEVPAERRNFWAVVPEDTVDEIAADQITGLDLADDVILLLRDHALTPLDHDELRAAAAPLLAWLDTKRRNRDGSSS